MTAVELKQMFHAFSVLGCPIAVEIEGKFMTCQLCCVVVHVSCMFILHVCCLLEE